MIFVSDELYEVWMTEDVARCNICISERVSQEIRVCRDMLLCCLGCICGVKQSSEKLESVHPLTQCMPGEQIAT